MTKSDNVYTLRPRHIRNGLGEDAWVVEETASDVSTYLHEGFEMEGWNYTRPDEWFSDIKSVTHYRDYDGVTEVIDRIIRKRLANQWRFVDAG